MMLLLKEELAEQVAQGILRKVPPEVTTPWIQGAVVVPKKNGGVRLCPDFWPLNKWFVGAKFDIPTPFQAVRSIPQGMRYFAVVDALKATTNVHSTRIQWHSQRSRQQRASISVPASRWAFATQATITADDSTTFSATSFIQPDAWRTSSSSPKRTMSTNNCWQQSSKRQTRTMWD